MSHSDMHAPVISAVIPCLNEEETLGACIEKAMQAFRTLGVAGQVVVSDNGSTDRSVAIACALGAKVVYQPVRGYGAALSAGIEAADAEIIVIGDADDSYDWSDIGGFVRAIEQGADLVIGNRFKGGIAAGAMPALHRYLGNPVLSFAARLAFGVPVGDFHCGMRAFTRKSFETMKTRTTGMEFATEMIANAAYEGLRVREIPTRLHPDKRSRASHLRSFHDGWRHLRFILMYAPDHFYFIPGFAMLIGGLMLLVLLAGGPVDVANVHLGIHFVALGALLSLAGLNVLNLGVLAKAILARRYTQLRSRTVWWLHANFRLEKGVLFGLGLIALGLTADGWILYQWLASDKGPMEQTVHLAFVATTVVVVGINAIFSSFLIAMLLAEDGGSS